MGDSIPEFRSHLGGTTSGDRGPTDILSTNVPAMTSWGFCGPLGRHSPRATDPRRQPSQKAVKRKIAGDAAEFGAHTSPRGPNVPNASDPGRSERCGGEIGRAHV